MQLRPGSVASQFRLDRANEQCQFSPSPALCLSFICKNHAAREISNPDIEVHRRIIRGRCTFCPNGNAGWGHSGPSTPARPSESGPNVVGIGPYLCRGGYLGLLMRMIADGCNPSARNYDRMMSRRLLEHRGRLGETFLWQQKQNSNRSVLRVAAQ